RSPRVIGSYRPWVNSRLSAWLPGSLGVPRQVPLRAPCSAPVALVEQPPARGVEGREGRRAAGDQAICRRLGLLRQRGVERTGLAGGSRRRTGAVGAVGGNTHFAGDGAAADVGLFGVLLADRIARQQAVIIGV